MRDAAPLTQWAAPLYWQPNPTEKIVAAPKHEATTPSNALVFVGMTPCRVVDTRPTSGFTGAFGPPNLIGDTARTFPLLSNTTCPIPPFAQASSLNVTVVPFGFLDYVTVWP